MPKFSFQHWRNSFLGVSFRFTTLVVIIFVAVILALKLNYLPYAKESAKANLILLLFICNISFVLGLTIEIISEKKEWNSIYKWGARMIPFLFGAILYFCLNPFFYQTDLYRIALLVVGVHFLVSSLPFIQNASIELFWEYNKRLFLGMLQSLLFSLVLYLGLIATAQSLDLLFNIDINKKFYSNTAILIFIGFNSWMFLSTIPKFSELNEHTFLYPKGLKIFAGYILLPLIGVYTAILMMYEIRIISLGEFPRGYIAYMVLAFSICGLLSYLLLYPIRNTEKWIGKFYRIYFIVMIPILIMMWISVGLRIEQYGVSEMRYMLAAITVWLSGIAIYFTLKKMPNIKWIPLSLSIISIGISFGPLSASFISQKSQQRELKNILEADTIYKSNVVNKMYYLSNHYGVESLKDWVEVPDSIQEIHPFGYKREFEIRPYIISYLDQFANVEEGLYDEYDYAINEPYEQNLVVYANADNYSVKQVHGAKFMVRFTQTIQLEPIDGESLYCSVKPDGIILISYKNKEYKKDLSSWFNDKFEELKNENRYRDNYLSESKLTEWVVEDQFKICFQSFTISKDKTTGEIKVDYYEANLFVY